MTPRPHNPSAAPPSHSLSCHPVFFFLFFLKKKNLLQQVFPFPYFIGLVWASAKHTHTHLQCARSGMTILFPSCQKHTRTHTHKQKKKQPKDKCETGPSTVSIHIKAVVRIKVAHCQCGEAGSSRSAAGRLQVPLVCDQTETY